MTYYLHNNGVVRNSIDCPGKDLYCNPQPVAVVAFEDREAVKRLVTLVMGIPQPFDIRTDDMQAALREFANPQPPKPDEPTGLGAVVEDADGYQWVRTGTPEGPHWYRDNAWAGEGDYTAINAVRVLSEGVQS